MLQECSPVVVGMLHTLLRDKEIEVKKAAVEVSCKVLLLHGDGAASVHRLMSCPMFLKNSQSSCWCSSTSMKWVRCTGAS